MFENRGPLTRTLVLASIICCGSAGLIGCGSQSANIGANTHSASTPPKGAFQQFKPNRYVRASSLTKKWMNVDSESHSVSVTVSLSANNLSLNTFYRGFAEIQVPVGWRVKLLFRNKNSDMSGKFAVVGLDNIASSTVRPAMNRAITPALSVDNSSKPTRVQFTPKRAGTYAVEFVPTAESGSWLWFVVDSNSTTPQVKLRK